MDAVAARAVAELAVREGWSDQARAAAAKARKLKKGQWGISRVGGLVQVVDPTPAAPGEVPSHHVGKISVRASGGRMRVAAHEIEPVDLKIKRVAPTGPETKRDQIHVDGEHVADVVHTEGSSAVVHQRIRVGSVSNKVWNHVGPGEHARVAYSGHSGRHAAIDRAVSEHRKRKGS